MVVGRDQRLFAAHEDVLSQSPFFAVALQENWLEAGTKKVTLQDEYGLLPHVDQGGVTDWLDREPEILSCVLEFLYKGDYYPRLINNKRRNTWELEDAQDLKNGGRGSSESTIYLAAVGGD